jgi:hypothetical protein
VLSKHLLLRLLFLFLLLFIILLFITIIIRELEAVKIVTMAVPVLVVAAESRLRLHRLEAGFVPASRGPEDIERVHKRWRKPVGGDQLAKRVGQPLHPMVAKPSALESLADANPASGVLVRFADAGGDV